MRKTNARVARLRKQRKEIAAEQMYMVDNTPMDLSESDDSSVSNSTEESL